MPIYEFRCETCGYIFERLQKVDDPWPPCPKCNSTQVFKLPSIFGFQDACGRRQEREKAVLKRARDYLLDGKVKEAQRFLKKAQEHLKTERLSHLSDALAQRKPQKGAYVSRTELVVTKKKAR